MIGDHLRAIPPSCNSADVEAAFVIALLPTEDLVAPPQERRLLGRRWTGDAQAEEELNMAMNAGQAAWKRQKAVTQDGQLKRAVRRAITHVQRRFIRKHALSLEEELRQLDQRGFFQRMKSLSIEDTRKVVSQYIHHEKGRMLRDPGYILGR